MRFTPYVLPLVLSVGVTISIGLYSRRFRDVPGAAPFAAAMLACALWALGYALDISSDSMTGKYVSEYIRFPALAFLPVAWLVMALQFTDRASFVTRGRLIALLAIPSVTCVLVWTSTRHALFRSLLRIEQGGPFSIVVFTNGPWFWVHMAWSYLLFAYAVTLLLSSLRGASATRRTQTLLLLIGMVMPVASDAVFQLGITPIEGFNAASSMTLPASILLGWALFRHGLWTVATIARGAVLEQTRDIMFVLDREDRLVDMNPAAESALGVAPGSVLGTSAIRALSRWPELTACIEGGSNSADVDRVDPAGTRVSYHLSVTMLEAADRRPIGRLLFLRDISERARVEDKLRESEERFRLMVDALPTAIILSRL